MDWKEALAQLGATPEGDAPAAPAPQTEAPGRKKRQGVVFSTDPTYEYDTPEDAPVETLPLRRQRLHVSMERSGRGGKTVSIVRGFQGSAEALEDLARLLKQRLGVGGAAKDGEIIIQGDRRQQIQQILKEEAAR